MCRHERLKSGGKLHKKYKKSEKISVNQQKSGLDPSWNYEGFYIIWCKI